MEQFFDEQNIASSLGEGNSEFAVIIVWKCVPEAIQRLARELARWTAENGEVQILGLTQMLAGNQPQVARRLFCIPQLMSNDPNRWTEKVALVTRSKTHPKSEEEFGKTLAQLIGRHPPARLLSYEEYCDQSR